MFHRILIANRGEIVQRIARTCRELGIETVGVYSEADRDAPWLAVVDRALCIGPARADRSYLDADSILQAAEQTDCQAIHPGYGFLSENARFAARCAQQGIAFIGPRADAIARMGDKSEAKRTMAAAGLPTIPGSAGTVPDARAAAAIAAEVGYPVLLKAVAGGGGKGMRRCDDASSVARGFAEATLEADKAFADAGLYLEKLIGGGRHVEFQVLCDAFGDAIHLGERECSVQRRHQKLVEESPSPALDAATRAAFGVRVASAVASVGYVNAGTVEFLRAPDGSLYFMEMNARLQVEHPVTEMVTGIDLVAEQIAVAASRPLSRRQPDVRFMGHAIEFRVNAEDPEAGFRPDPGLVTSFTPPSCDLEGVTVRWDSAVRAGWKVPPHYDSMIGKLIVHAPDRQRALAGARVALSRLKVEGIRTTQPLHLRILDDPAFASGRYDLDLLARPGLLATA